MLNIIASIILASLFVTAGFDFFAQRSVDFSYAPPDSAAVISGPQRLVNSSVGIKTTATSVLIVDRESNKVLYSTDDKAVRPIASITKLVTALTFLRHNPGWDTVVTITAADQREGGLVKLLPGDEVTVKDLYYLTLISSTNEAAAALARSTGVENFAAAMNTTAFSLGLQDSSFFEPTGLDARNVASATDLAFLARAAFENPEVAPVLRQQQYQFVVQNTARLVTAQSTDDILASFINRDQYQIVGAKTGYLDEAGYCFLFEIKRADADPVIVVLLGAATETDRWQEAKGLVDWVYRNYQWP